MYKFDELTSTLDEARDKKYVHGDLIVAHRQTAGRGQRGRAWTSGEGENLLIAQVWEPDIPASEHFSILQKVALALVDFFRSYGLDARIKWTNDIYIGNRKIVGILIENDIVQGRIVRSAAGIGVNVNQIVFDPALPNPTSMRVELGREIDLDEALSRLDECLEIQYNIAPRGAIMDRYHSCLYLLNTPAPYALPDGTRFTATLRCVRPTGELVLEMEDGTQQEFTFGAVFFLIFTP